MIEPIQGLPVGHQLLWGIGFSFIVSIVFIFIYREIKARRK